MKVCSKCKEVKDESLFGKDKRVKSGLHSQCKTCLSERRRKYYQTHKDDAIVKARKYAIEHPEQTKAANLKWRRAHPEQHHSTYLKWKQNHPERAKASTQKWRDNNLEHVKAVYRNWVIEHPEQRKNSMRKSHHERRVKLASTPFPKEFKLASECWICGSTEKLTIDHIVPVSRGGDNSIENLTTLCKSCNSSKGSRLYSEWFEWRAFKFQTWLLNEVAELAADAAEEK